MAAVNEPIILDLNGCARCHGEGHPGIHFALLTFPVENEDGEVLATHWARCPRTGEPILLMMIDEEKG